MAQWRPFTRASETLLQSRKVIRQFTKKDSRRCGGAQSFAVFSFIVMCTLPERAGPIMSSNVDDDAEQLGKQSAYEDTTEFKQRLRRGDESKGDPDERDVAGDYAEDSSTADTARDQGLVRRDIPS